MERTLSVLKLLEKEYPNAKCELNYTTPFELLVAVILSAQCTDKRVNEVTRELFQKWNTPQDFARLNQEELEKEIYSCGFYRNKAKSIISASKSLLEKYNGEVPSQFDELLSLSGVGRKTANVVTSVAFDGDGIAVDTHVFRTSHRLGLSNGKTPNDVEKDLTQKIPAKLRKSAHHLLIFHGRYRCKSLSPLCDGCALKGYCVCDIKRG